MLSQSYYAYEPTDMIIRKQMHANLSWRCSSFVGWWSRGWSCGAQGHSWQEGQLGSDRRSLLIWWVCSRIAESAHTVPARSPNGSLLWPLPPRLISLTSPPFFPLFPCAFPCLTLKQGSLTWQFVSRTSGVSWSPWIVYLKSPLGCSHTAAALTRSFLRLLSIHLSLKS